MTIKASKLAIAIAVIGPLAIAVTGGSYAAPLLSGAAALKVAAPGKAMMDVRYRKHVRQQNSDYYSSADWGCRDPLSGTYLDNVAPYGSRNCHSPYVGSPFNNVAPY
jgi:hypothetical protein